MRIVHVGANGKLPYYYEVELEDGRILSVHEDQVVKHRLIAGESVSEETMMRVEADRRTQQALEDALSYLSRKPRTEQEIRRRLKEKAHEPEAIAQALDRLREHRYVDDEAFAMRWGEERLRSMRKGRRVIQQELSQKGVAKEAIRKAIDALDPEQERQMAMELAVAKWKRLKGDGREKAAKTGAFLLRRGYPNAVVLPVLRRLQASMRDGGDLDDFWPDAFDPEE